MPVSPSAVLPVHQPPPGASEVMVTMSPRRKLMSAAAATRRETPEDTPWYRVRSW